jgi:hypothetical protein
VKKAKLTPILKPAAHDLFGQVPVSWSEVDAWILAVAGLAPDDWRAAYYRQHWRVAEKVAAAKAAGTYDAAIAAARIR